MAALFSMNHALFEIEQLRRRDLNALDADSRTMAVRPQVAREDVAEKISLHYLVVLDTREKAVLTLKLRVGSSMVAAGFDGVGLPDITPSVTGLCADMFRKKITPLGIHVEVRTGVASRADGGFQSLARAVTEPAGQKLPLRVVFGLALHGVALPTEVLQLCADRIVLTVGDFFSNPSDICHDNLLKVSYFAG